MSELVLEVPERIMQKLASWALAQGKRIEDAVLERLEEILESEEQNLEERYEAFFRNSGLFVQVSEEEKKRYKPVSEARRRELAIKASVGEKPLSEILIEERGEI